MFNTAAGDPPSGSKGKGQSAKMDGYYTVKIDNWPGAADDDLDSSISAILSWLEQNDAVFQRPDLDANSLLLGAVIKGGTQTTQYYAYGAHNTNGTDPDSLPSGLGFGLPGDHRGETPPSAIDVSYEYSAIFVPSFTVTAWEVFGA